MSEEIVDKSRPITLVEAAQIYGFSRNYLGNLVRKGRLEAYKSGGIWLTTPADVEAFIESRQHKGKYRDDIGS
jgi:excisionase family DNA binding protein